jgi:hypothetical protein
VLLGGTGITTPVFFNLRRSRGEQDMGSGAGKIRSPGTFILGAVTLFMMGCSQPSMQVTELKHFSLKNAEGINTRSHVTVDNQISSDGKGALRIDVTAPSVVRLFEVRELDLENARLIFQAKVRTEGVDGQVYLEMWCHFPGKGEFFSRGLQTPLTS